MRIIDLDSLVMFDDWVCPKNDKRYLPAAPLAGRRELKSALDFLFCQVIVITDSRLGAIQEDEADAKGILAKNDMIQSWVNEDPLPKCNASFILEALERIGEKVGVSETSDAVAAAAAESSP
jgi:hypothetical protein